MNSHNNPLANQPSMLKTVSIATKENFDPKGYLELNPDLMIAFGLDFEKAYQHLPKYGLTESRYQLNHSAIIEARKNKLKKFRDVLDLAMFHEVHDCGTYNFLSPNIKEQFRVFDTTNISSNMYHYEGLEHKEDCLILDCGAGFRNDYFSNILYFEIVNYLSTDVIGVGEQLPFKDNSFDAIFSYAVLNMLQTPSNVQKRLFVYVNPVDLYIVGLFSCNLITVIHHIILTLHLAEQDYSLTQI